MTCIGEDNTINYQFIARIDTIGKVGIKDGSGKENVNDVVRFPNPLASDIHGSWGTWLISHCLRVYTGGENLQLIW